MKYHYVTSAPVEFTIALTTVTLLTSAAVQTWSRRHKHAWRIVAHTALVSTTMELECQYVHTGNNSSLTDIPEYISGYHLLVGPCDGRVAAHRIEVITQPVHVGTNCGVLILHSTGERFTQTGNTRQPASPAYWS